ncbi:cilia- and flagella-associated protein 53 [Genypterus blacodes]|uniref:cilia- and flagella-associated protein 53 n=1 Tax=Genypterus blacodes TaxID=154954 RepID=UPI003F75BB4B
MLLASMVTETAARQRTGLQCRLVTGVTPHSVAVESKMSVLKGSGLHYTGRKTKEGAHEEMLAFTKYQQTWDLKTSWLKSTDRHILKGTIRRQVKDAMNQYEMSLEERRARLRRMLEAEEMQLLEEIDAKKETSLERKAKMQERAKMLKERRETERQQLVSHKLDQLFSERCEELRTIQTKRREEQVCVERAAQLQTQKERRQLQQYEEKVFAELWQADWQAKEERESQQLQQQQHKNMEQQDLLRTQIETAEGQRQQDKQLKEEEAQLLQEQRELLRLEEQREQHQKLGAQEKRRRQLDQCLRLKMKRLAREQQEELALDMSILQHLLNQATDEKQEAAQRKIELHEEQQRYRQYLALELEKQKRQEEEIDHLIEAELEKNWAKRDKQRQMQGLARNNLMKEVMETRSLQIQQKLDMNRQKQIQLAEERDEVNKVSEEMKLLDEEEKSRNKQTSQAYQADLLAQMMHQQHLQCEEKAEAEREYQQGLDMQEQHNKRKQEILSRPTSHTTVTHNFRRTGGSRFGSAHPFH